MKFSTVHAYLSYIFQAFLKPFYLFFLQALKPIMVGLLSLQCNMTDFKIRFVYNCVPTFLLMTPDLDKAFYSD